MLTLAALEKALMDLQETVEAMRGHLAAVSERNDGIANRLAETAQLVPCSTCQTVHTILWVEL